MNEIDRLWSTPQFRSFLEDVIEDPHNDLFIEGLMAESDFPHSKFHSIQVARAAYVIALETGEPDEVTLNSMVWAGLEHDQGYRLTNKAGVFLEYHPIASVLLSSYSLEDKIDPKLVTEAIIHHADDVLPDRTSFAVRAVRDADRVMGEIGWGSVIRHAYYLGPGFRHPSFTKRSEDEVILDGVLCDMRAPSVEGYEENVQRFVLENVLPFLKSNNLVNDMLERNTLSFERIFGKKSNDGILLVEPVTKTALNFAIQRFEASLQFREVLLGSKSSKNENQ